MKTITCWPSMPRNLSPGNPMLQVPISWVMIYECLLEQCYFQKRHHVLFNQLSLSLQAMMHSWIVTMWILWELQHVQKNGCRPASFGHSESFGQLDLLELLPVRAAAIICGSYTFCRWYGWAFLPRTAHGVTISSFPKKKTILNCNFQEWHHLSSP